jgi:hypothetical protein
MQMVETEPVYCSDGATISEIVVTRCPHTVCRQKFSSLNTAANEAFRDHSRLMQQSTQMSFNCETA